MLVNGMLGRKPARIDPRTLKMSRLVLPKPPSTQMWCSAISDWGMMENDVLGDCVFAAMGHAIQVWSRATGKELTLPDATIVDAYSRWAGYVPGDPSTDNGATELDALNLWRKQDLGGEKLIGYADPRPGDTVHVQQAVWLFGGLMIGLDLPISAQTQDTWDTMPKGDPDSDPGSWGGHAVQVIGYDSRVLTFVTWGALKQMTWAFWNRYCVSPETKILTSDLRWIPASDVKIGDGLMAFDENRVRRGWKQATVLNCPLINQRCYDLTFSDGTRVRCSADHKWLTHHHGGARWIATESLRDGKRCSSNVVKPLDTWETETSRTAGYLAAAFDGEGHLSQRDLSSSRCGRFSSKLGFAQKPNPMYAHVKECLSTMDFPFHSSRRLNSSHGHGVATIGISRRRDVLRFLGSIRPVRLLPKFRPDSCGMMSLSTVKLRDKKYVGVQEVVGLVTDTQTYIAEGLASHNCSESHALLSARWLSGAPQAYRFLGDLQAELAALS